MTPVGSPAPAGWPKIRAVGGETRWGEIRVGRDVPTMVGHEVSPKTREARMATILFEPPGGDASPERQ